MLQIKGRREREAEVTPLETWKKSNIQRIFNHCNPSEFTQLVHTTEELNGYSHAKTNKQTTEETRRWM